MGCSVHDPKANLHIQALVWHWLWHAFGLHQLDACLACADDLVHQHFHELAHVGCHIVHLGTSNDAECDPTGGGLQMCVEFVEAAINGPQGHFLEQGHFLFSHIRTKDCH